WPCRDGKDKDANRRHGQRVEGPFNLAALLRTEAAVAQDEERERGDDGNEVGTQHRSGRGAERVKPAHVEGAGGVERHPAELIGADSGRADQLEQLHGYEYGWQPAHQEALVSMLV